MSRLLLFVLFALTSSVLFSQEERPDGPPWTDVCKDEDRSGFSLIFKHDERETEFLKVFSAESSIESIHKWMIERREIFREWAHFSWVAHFYNDLKMSQLAWLHQLYIAVERFLPNSGCGNLACYQEKVVSILSRGTETEISPAAIQQTNVFLDMIEQDQTFKESMEKGYAAVRPICLYHLNSQCIGAMKKIMDWMYPRSYKLPVPIKETITMSMIPFYRKVFTDTLTQQYASRFALFLTDYISLGAFQDGRATSVYETGLEYFEQDQDRFWQFMIVYATRGAAWATGYQMVTEENQPIFAAMMVISAAMQVLDSSYAAQGKAWSYGTLVDSTCFQAKPYHFWMTAGYVYLLRKEGYSEATSKLVARLLGAMYEAGSETQGRDPDEVFFLPTFHTKVNRARREVLHHYLGAEFGAHYLTPKAPQFDETYLAIMQASKALPDLSDEEMSGRIEDSLTRWKYWTSLSGYYFKR